MVSPPTSTIVAPATPPGEGGVAVFRISGPQAFPLLLQVFSGRTPVPAMEPRRLYLGRLQDSSGARVDEVLAVIMPAPHSYTGEDVVELHCHGGSQMRRRVLDLMLEAGACLAMPGEFTQRAFLNGRLDLVQAEAVIEVIRSRSERAARLALDQLDGKLSRCLHRFAERLKSALALLEAHIDFPDDEVGTLDITSLGKEVSVVAAEMTRLAETFDAGRVLREGLNLLILGRPNVGKSSLMNALLGETRAIVTEIAGTTRDTLEEQMLLGGFPVRLIDSAGVRESSDPVELEGVRRARAKAATADIILLVVDCSQAVSEEDFLAAELCDPARTVLVLNKSDLPTRFSPDELGDYPHRIQVSAKLGTGIEAVQTAVATLCAGPGESRGESRTDANEELVLAERRHYEALLRAIQALVRFADDAEFAAVPLECLAIELREALAALGQITGETTPDEILEQIFSRFCIGK